MTSVEEDFEGFRKAASILSNPLYLQATKIAELDNYQERQRTYHSQERTLSQPCIDQLIRSIASGHNSYQDLQQKVPDINSPTMCAYIATAFKDDPKRPSSPMSLTSLRFANQKLHYFQVNPVPEDFYDLYEFKPTDSFSLSVAGENRWYDLKQEDLMLSLTKQSINSAETAVKWTKIGIVVSVVLFLLEKVLSRL